MIRILNKGHPSGTVREGDDLRCYEISITDSQARLQTITHVEHHRSRGLAALLRSAADAVEAAELERKAELTNLVTEMLKDA